MAVAVSRQWTRVRTLGRGASGAEVFLAVDQVSGELFAVKSVGAADAAALRREQGVMAGLSSPHVVPCIGGHVGRDGSYQMFLEFAPGGSLADVVARSGGRMEERAVGEYAADVARGLAYLHGMGLVHGDVKARNVMIGGDGRAKLADFGCARWADSARPIGGTPAFMAPEVARGEEQRPAADVWALGCTVIEMATGRAPWSDMDDVLAAVHRIGYTEAVPEVPGWLSADAKDFLARCLQRRPIDRSTAAQLLEHPFVASAARDGKPEDAKSKWVSPKSTLDAALWESDTEEEEDDDDLSQSTAERIGSLACAASSLPDWDSDDGWIDVISTPTEESCSTTTSPTDEETTTDLNGDIAIAEFELPHIDLDRSNGNTAHNVGEANAQQILLPSNIVFDQLPYMHSHREGNQTTAAMDAAGIGGGGGGRRLTRLRTLGRGASGAVVSLFKAGDDELLAVKSAAGPAGAAQLRREGGILASLCSPHVLPCFGFGAVAGGEYRLLLEFAPGGSLADEVARNGGRLEEDAIRAYAADVASGLAYLHGVEMVHGDVKGRNVVIGADGRAKLADFGCARPAGSAGPIGGTPAFMAPEVARGEEQGPAADVWALGCTVIEMATGRAPWSGVDDVVAAVRLIGFTDAVPEYPEWLSPEAKDFLDKCLRRRAGERWTAGQLLEHPFLAFAGCGGVKAEETKPKWVSPKSTLDAAFWESDADDEDDDMPESSAERIMALAIPCSALPDWESDDGWIDVMSNQSELSIAADETPAEQTCSEVSESPVASPALETTSYASVWDERSEEEMDADVDDDDELVHNVRTVDTFVDEQLRQDIYLDFTSDPIVLHVDISDERKVKLLPPIPGFLCSFLFLPFSCFFDFIHSNLTILQTQTTNLSINCSERWNVNRNL
uniref:Protein kinase domain-containing protein n=1 Tax=Oryza punctata TaxID=4537 RepID=A0A0E0L597_ORYPU